MIKIVYLDVDGVLADFHKGVHNAFNKLYDYLSAYRYDFWEDWEEPTSRDDVNSICNKKFWENLEWMHDGHDILREVVKYFKPKQVYILTAPMPNEESYAGKQAWIKENLPEYCEQTIITRTPKYLLAKSETLLIDDKDSNVEEFVTAGGDAILVPRPWNKLYKDKDCAWFTVATELVKRMDGCKLL